MYNTFEDYVDDKMSDQKKVLKEISATVDSNQKTINSTVKEKTAELGSTLSQTMKNILKEPISNSGITIEQAISKKDTDIAAIAASTSSTDSILQNYINSYDKDGFKTHIKNISEKINTIDTNLVAIANSLGLKVDQTNTLDNKAQVNAVDAGKTLGSTLTGISGGGTKTLGESVTGGTGLNTNTNNDIKLATSGNFYHSVVASDFYQNGQYGNYRIGDPRSAKLIYDTMMNKEETKLLKNDSRYGEFDINNPTKYYKYMYQWLKRNGYVGYASGVRRLRDDELAWTQENGLEAIIRPSDGAILTPLAKNDSVLNAGATQNIWDMANNPMKFIKDNLSFPVNVSSTNGGTFDIQQSMAITLPNVKNYQEFVTALQHDKKFEQMLQDMTVNQLTGGSTLAKYKYKY